MAISNNANPGQHAGVPDPDLRSALDQSPGFFLILKGQHLIIQFANKGFLQAWNVSAAVVGQALTVALPRFSGTVILKIIKEVMATGLPNPGRELKEISEPDPHREV